VRADHEHECKNRCARIKERQHASRDTNNAAEHQWPPTTAAAGCHKSETENDDPVDNRIGTESQDEDLEREAWPDKGDNTEDHGKRAAERDQPPVARNG